MVCEYVELSAINDKEGAVDQAFCVMIEVIQQVKERIGKEKKMSFF